MKLLNTLFNIAAGERATVPPSHTGSVHTVNYWQESGWVRRGNCLNGYYRTFYGSFKGIVELKHSGNHRFFIIAPPSELKKHPHWPCFLWRGNGKYVLHFDKLPKNVDEGIIAMEKLIQEAKERY